MELIVAEKPKVAQKIAFALGDAKRKVLNGVGYYELDGGKRIVAAAVGHIYTLTEKKRTNTYPVFDITWKPSYEVSKSSYYTRKYLSVLEHFAKKADSFVSACDYDIEGSLIAYNIFRFLYKKEEGKRMKFSTITIGELKSAYEHAGDFDFNNAYAGEARHVIDWYYGINLSRALMSALKRANGFKIMSIGRVQGPALKILTDREREILSFVPEDYWEIEIKANGVKFSSKRGKIFNKEEAERIFSSLGNSARVVSVEKKEETVYPLPNFDLTSLQVEAYRLFRLKPSTTLKIAQELYENSFISYPRTSSQKIPPNINLRRILEKLKDHPDEGETVTRLLNENKVRAWQGKKEDKAHPAIHPTGIVKGLEKLSDGAKKIYNLILLRFLSSLEEPALRERTTISLDVNGEGFSASGSLLKKKGWIAIYQKYYKGDEKEVPKFSEGEIIPLDDKKKTKKKTKPPRRYTDASIVSELEKRHLGTKATRAVIVETLHKRGYISGTTLSVSSFGIAVTEVLEKYAPEILDEELTRKLEIDMEKIQDGLKDKDDVIKEGKEILEKTLDNFKKNEERIGKDLINALKKTEKEESLGKCPKCGGELLIRRWKGGRFVGCSNYPKCTFGFPIPQKGKIVPTGETCENGLPQLRVVSGRKRWDFCPGDFKNKNNKDSSKNTKNKKGKS